MAKYAPGATISVPITERVSVVAPLVSVGPPLLLAELYQQVGRREDAIGLMHTKAAINPNAANPRRGGFISSLLETQLLSPVTASYAGLLHTATPAERANPLVILCNRTQFCSGTKKQLPRQS